MINDFRKYKKFVEYKQSIGEANYFGWDNDIKEFEITSVVEDYELSMYTQSLKSSSQSGSVVPPGRTTIKIYIQYEDDYYPGFDVNSSGKKIYYKSLEYYTSEYDEYITEIRNNKLNELGI